MKVMLVALVLGLAAVSQADLATDYQMQNPVAQINGCGAKNLWVCQNALRDVGLINSPELVERAEVEVRKTHKGEAVDVYFKLKDGKILKGSGMFGSGLT